MSAVTIPATLTPEDVERASRRDERRYELINGELREKIVGWEPLFIAGRIAGRLNTCLYPRHGAAAVGPMIYCFDRPDYGPKPDVVYVRLERLPDRQIPREDLHLPPDLAAEVLSPDTRALDLEVRLDDYLSAGIPLVWIVNPNRRTIRVYRSDGTTRSFQAKDLVENEPLLSGFRMVVGEVFPQMPASYLFVEYCPWK